MAVVKEKLELEKEEEFLQGIKEKLLDQLQRLKVEELALQKYISMTNDQNTTTTTTTASYFTKQTSSNDVENMDQSQNDVNQLPISLQSHALSNLTQVVEEEEDEEDD